MAVVKGHAVRRREGLAPNTLIMAQRGSTSAEPPDLSCPAGRCKQSFGWNDFASRDEHVALVHPRSQHAGPARQRTLDRKYMDPVSEILSRG